MKHINKIIFVVLIALFNVSCAYKVVLEGGEKYLKPTPSKYAATSGADPLFDKQWYLNKIKASNAWTYSKGSSAVKVAIISTGINYNHPDLNKNIMFNSAELMNIGTPATRLGNKVDEDQNGYVDDFVGYDFIAKDGFANDDIGWGTAVAGIIGATHDNGLGIKGINNNVSLIPIKYINENGNAMFLDLIDSLKYASAVQSDVIFIHLVEFKMAPDGTNLLEKTLKDLNAKNIPVVVSAGNGAASVSVDGKNMASIFSKFSNVLVVTATDENDQKMLISNYGDGVSISAPGKGILSTTLGDEYKEYFGTTVAAAQVAGAVSLAISYKGAQLGNAEIINAVKAYENTNTVNGLTPGSGLGNYGLLNLEKFFSAISAK